jgi:hypothetical protein
MTSEVFGVWLAVVSRLRRQELASVWRRGHTGEGREPLEQEASDYCGRKVELSPARWPNQASTFEFVPMFCISIVEISSTIQ